MNLTIRETYRHCLASSNKISPRERVASTSRDTLAFVALSVLKRIGQRGFIQLWIPSRASFAVKLNRFHDTNVPV